ncbi:hypothetical protein D3C87_1683490 [compost metagenome]
MHAGHGREVLDKIGCPKILAVGVTPVPARRQFEPAALDCVEHSLNTIVTWPGSLFFGSPVRNGRRDDSIGGVFFT